MHLQYNYKQLLNKIILTIVKIAQVCIQYMDCNSAFGYVIVLEEKIPCSKSNQMRES